MSTHADTDAPASEAAATKGRISPHHLAIALGIGVAVFTVISGIVPLITDWHNDSPIHREVFGDVPGPLKVAFYTVIPVVIAWGAFRFADRMKNWERGGPARRRRTTPTNAKRRFGDFRAGVYMQTLLRDPAAGLMHSMIYFGFLVLLGVTTVLEIDHQLPADLKFLHGVDVPGVRLRRRRSPGSCSSAAWSWAIVRRYVQRPYRIRIKTKPEHVVILGTFLLIGAHRLRRRDVPHRPAVRRGREHGLRAVELHRLPAQPARRRLVGVDAADLAPVDVDRHVVAFVVFLVILPSRCCATCSRRR